MTSNDENEPCIPLEELVNLLSEVGIDLPKCATQTKEWLIESLHEWYDGPSIDADAEPEIVTISGHRPIVEQFKAIDQGNTKKSRRQAAKLLADIDQFDASHRDAIAKAEEFHRKALDNLKPTSEFILQGYRIVEGHSHIRMQCEAMLNQTTSSKDK